MSETLARARAGDKAVAQGGAEVARAMRAELKRRAAIAEAGPKVVDMAEARRPLGKARAFGALFFGPAAAVTAEPPPAERGVVLPLRRVETTAPTGQLSQPLERGPHLAPDATVSRHLDGSGPTGVIAPDRIVVFDPTELPPTPEPKPARASGLGAATLALVMLAAMVSIAVGLLRGV